MEEMYLENDTGTAKVKLVTEFGKTRKEENLEHARLVKEALYNYKWNDKDFLLQSYPKNGCHITWEIMSMLLRGSPDYIKESKIYCMIGLTPVTKSGEWFSSPKVLNTHYRSDVLPEEFRGKKTVLSLRNGKDTIVSLYEHMIRLAANMDPDNQALAEISALPFSDFLQTALNDKNQYYGTYFDYVEYMWSLRDDPNILVIYFEDLVTDPVPTIQKLNEFMGTERSPELVQQIADAMNIEKMREGKAASMDDTREKIGLFDSAKTGSAKEVYRKGKIGDWKNYFTVADNELFDQVLEKWSVGKEIPFRYEV